MASNLSPWSTKQSEQSRNPADAVICATLLPPPKPVPALIATRLIADRLPERSFISTITGWLRGLKARHLSSSFWRHRSLSGPCRCQLLDFLRSNAINKTEAVAEALRNELQCVAEAAPLERGFGRPGIASCRARRRGSRRTRPSSMNAAAISAVRRCLRHHRHPDEPAGCPGAPSPSAFAKGSGRLPEAHTPGWNSGRTTPILTLWTTRYPWHLPAGSKPLQRARLSSPPG